MGSGLATACEMLAFTLWTIASGCRALTACSLLLSINPLEQRIVTSVKGSEVSLPVGVSRVCLLACCVGGAATIAAYERSVTMICWRGWLVWSTFLPPHLCLCLLVTGVQPSFWVWGVGLGSVIRVVCVALWGLAVLSAIIFVT